MIELTCRELVELVTEYLEGAMPSAERMRFEEHVQMCEGCDVYVDQMRETIRLLGTLNEESIPPETERQLRRAFRDWKPA